MVAGHSRKKTARFMKTSKYLISVELDHTVRDIEASHGETILEALNRAKIEINQVCGGGASCGTCQIRHLKGTLGLPNELELEMKTDRSFDQFERLACQAQVESDITIKIKNR
jgi:ferredoxin